MTLGDVIKQFRTERGWSMDKFAQESNLSKAYVSILERNCNPSTGKPAIPSLETIKAAAAAMNMDVNYLISVVDPDQMVDLNPDFEPAIPHGFEPMPKMATVPRVSAIACGDPILAEQNIEDYDKVPEGWHATFTLVCEGDSMLPRIQNGDIVAIRKQPRVENGEIAAVRIDDEATLKHVYYSPDKLILQPENPAYPPIVLIGEEINRVTIEGKAVGLCRNL